LRIFLGALALIAAAFLLWGVGSAVRRLAGARTGCWPVSIGVGLAVIVCVGGVLNLAHIAYGPVLWLVAAVAAIISVLEARRANLSAAQIVPKETSARIELGAAVIVTSAVALFAIVTQLPPGLFNFQDDLEKYLAHPVRMLATGTMSGSPLSALGSETLGGQAFLHGFVLSALPLPYVNGVDSVFGLFALMLIAAAAGWRRFGWPVGAPLAALVVAIVNPLYVNVSAIYIGALLIATAVMLVGDRDDDASPPLLGLVYAALVAVKPIYGLFAALHLSFFFIAEGFQSGKWRSALTRAVRAGVWAAIFVAPWFAMYLPAYLSRGAFAAQTTPTPDDSAGVSLFSPARIFDGDSIVPFTMLAFAGVVVAIFAVLAWKTPSAQKEQPSDREKPLGIFAGAATGVASYLVLILYLSRWGGYLPCVRYAAPFLLGTCVIATMQAASLSGKLPRSLFTMGAAVCALATVALFAPGAVHRYEKAQQFHTILSFPAATQSPLYAPYIQFSLSPEARQQIADLQSQVPAGEPILAWIDTPYFLDYRRNRMIDVDVAGTATKWASVPADVQYYLWQYEGLGVWKEGDYVYRMHAGGLGARDRLIATRSFDFANTLSELASHAQIIARLDAGDDHYVLFRATNTRVN
jgi:hypothetical protein